MMSDEPSDFPEIPAVPTDDAPPRVRRISNKRPKKAAEAPVESAPEPAAAEEPAEAPAPVAEREEADEADEADEAESNAPNGDWTDPETSGGSESENAKRKRRRKKGKGGNGQPAGAIQETVISLAPAEDAPESAEAPRQERQERQERRPQQERPQPQERERERERERDRDRDRERERQQPAQPSQPRTKIDPEELAKKAWKIYLAEVSEEGVALIGDSDARELSRRCFRLAEIFIEEQSRRR